MSQITIAIDAGGGDFAPKNEVYGTQYLLKNPKYKDLNIVFVGKKEEISRYAEEASLDKSRYTVVDAPEVITFHDNPTEAYKTKKDASMPTGFKLLKEGQADCFVSGGNTGAMLTGAVLILGRLSGVKRPAIGSWLPSAGKLGKTFVLDVGATVDMNPRFLFEYAQMGSIFVQMTEGVDKPSVGLLNVGSEDGKGPEATKEALKMLRKSDLNFQGNIEGGDIFSGTVDVAVCDGYTGNIVLKFAESIPKLLKSQMINFSRQGTMKKVKTGIAKPVLKEVLSGLDYENFGGVPILGCNGIAMVCHGKSSPKAYESAIINTYEMKKTGFLESVTDKLK